MDKSKTAAVIFKDKPNTWGLRGDPYFWEELKKRFISVNLPLSVWEFMEEFDSVFSHVTGKSLNADDNFFVENYNGGGMFGGMLSGEFWCKIRSELIMRLNVQNALWESEKYAKFWPVELGGIDCSPGKVVFIAESGKELLKADYENFYIRVFMNNVDLCGFVGYCVDIIDKKSGNIIYSSDTFSDKIFIREALLEAVKKARTL